MSTHYVYQVPGPEGTYTLACCAIEGRRHGEKQLLVLMENCGIYECGIRREVRRQPGK